MSCRAFSTFSASLGNTPEPKPPIVTYRWISLTSVEELDINILKMVPGSEIELPFGCC